MHALDLGPTGGSVQLLRDKFARLGITFCFCNQPPLSEIKYIFSGIHGSCKEIPQELLALLLGVNHDTAKHLVNHDKQCT